MSLNFYAQISVLGTAARQRGRFYLHNDGIQAYGLNPLQSGREEFSKVTDFLVDHAKVYPWAIGILWGKDNSRIVDLFAYSDVTTLNWNENPSANNARFIDGVMIQKPDSLTCGDGLIALGREESHRRTCRSIDDYLRDPPRFPTADIKFPRIF